jgi:glycosyltransferase involved in cell wall biosynthesis
MKNRDFVITGLQSWDIPIGSNASDIAKEISVNNRVLYVNPALDLMILYRNEQKLDIQHRIEVYKKKKPTLRKLSNTLWILDFPFIVWSVNGLPDGAIFDFFNKWNNRKIFRHVNKIAGELGFKDIIHLIDNDIYRSFYSKEYLNSSLSVYYRRDNLQAFSWWKRHAGRLEPEIIRKSDVVVCNSPQLADFAREFNPKSYYVGQGVDLSAYNPDAVYPLPKELEGIPEPRIGYIGDINSLRLDPDLLYELAKSKPDYSFVMIGREDTVFMEHQLHTLKNVFFPGSVPKNRVAEYMSALNVCLNPQKLNEITIGNYPRKVDEYLAMGKPVIATKTDTMEMFREHTYLCTDLKEYGEAVEKALADTGKDSSMQRVLFARSHSWENNVNNIYKYIKELTK